MPTDGADDVGRLGVEGRRIVRGIAHIHPLGVCESFPLCSVQRQRIRIPAVCVAMCECECWVSDLLPA